jgi:parvulin-like peptidyl-prolyl isomerase
MNVVLKIGDQAIAEQELYPLLSKFQLLPQLAKEIIVEKAIADQVCTPAEVELALKQFCDRQQLTTQDQLTDWLAHQGLSREQLDYVVQKDIKIEKFKQATWGDQLEAHFFKYKGQLDRVVYSLIRTQEAGIAQELYFRILEGEQQFSDIARQYSQGSEAQTGGLIGPVELNVPHPQVSSILANSQPGKLSPPTKVGDWWIIVRLEKYLSAQLDNATRQRLLNDLFQGWLKTQLEQTVTFEPLTERLEISS